MSETNTQDTTPETSFEDVIREAIAFADNYAGDGGDERRDEWREMVGDLIPAEMVPDGFMAVEFGKTGYPVLVPVRMKAAERHFNGTKHAATGTEGIMAALAAKATHGAEHLRKPLGEKKTREDAARNLMRVGHPAIGKAAPQVDGKKLANLSGAELLAYLAEQGIAVK